MVCGSAEEAERIESQLKLVIRPMYSNPPIHGARIVEEVLGDPKPTPNPTPNPNPNPNPNQVLGDPKLEAQWRAECSQMAERIIAMRAALSKALTAAGSTRDWSHVTSQIGMFCFSGMCADRTRSHGVAWGRMGWHGIA
jgi:aspartate aminotransferase